MTTRPTSERRTTPASLTLLFHELLGRRLAPAGIAWLDDALAVPATPDEYVTTLALATRKLGKTVVKPTPEEAERLVAEGIAWSIAAWGLDELGRARLLLAAADRLTGAELQALVADYFRTGDNRERTAVLRALPLLPDPDRFCDLAVDACRTSVQPVFEAIACENPYPSAHFPELNFNQMVLKALFTGVALERIVGLDAHLTPELARMARDYASERKAAGRSLPPDIGRLLQGDNRS